MTDSTTEAVNVLKAAFKSRGWNQRRVSVRKHNYSMGSSIYVTVHDAAIDLAEVSAIAHEVEHIRYCEITGEILGGGNLYVHARHSDDAKRALAAKWLAALTATIDRVKAAHMTEGQGYEIEQTGVALLVGRWANTFDLRADSGAPYQISAENEYALADAAYQLSQMSAEMAAKRSARAEEAQVSA